MSNSQYLYDEGEENWNQKWHLGCGGIYLDGYYNVDISGMTALEHPDLVEMNKTTIKDYYARLNGGMNHLPIRRETVVDLFSDLSIPFTMSEVIDKIVAIQLLEHFTPVKSLNVLRGWNNALKCGHPLVMSVPDMAGTLDLIGNGNHEFALRHLRGQQRDKWNMHYAWYSQDSLIELLQFAGFWRVEVLPNFHFYPAICVRAIRL